MNHRQIIKMLRSGKFTIIYWDNDCPSLYKGSWKQEGRDEAYDKKMQEYEI